MNREYLIQLTKKLYSLTVLFPKKEPLRYKMREVAICILADPKTEDLEVLDSFFEVAKAQRWIKQNDMVAMQEEYAKLKDELTKPKADERQLILEGDLLKKPEDLRQDLQDEKTGANAKDLYFHLHLPSPAAIGLLTEQKEEFSNSLALGESLNKEKPEEIKSPIINIGHVASQKEKKDLKMGSMQERQEKIMDFLKESGRAQVWQTKQILPEVTKRTLRRDFEHMLKKGLIERVGERNETYYQVKLR